MQVLCWKGQRSFPTDPVSWEKQNNTRLKRKNHAFSVISSLKISLHVMEILTFKGQHFYNERRRKYNRIKLK